MSDDYTRCFRYPVWFFSGLILGFAFCCLAGFLCSRVDTFRNFGRFHCFVSPHTCYYPTANQMLNLVTKHARRDQIITIIGGDSILHGYGQPIEDLWSLKLQELLGDRYFVVNLSMEGTFPFEGGSWVAEALAKENWKVILLTDAEPTEVGIAPGVVLNQTYFDFRNRELLMDYKERDRKVQELIMAEQENHDFTLTEASLSRDTDRIASASDLWNWVGYNCFFTIWTENASFLVPKRFYSDTFFPPAPQPDPDVLKTKARDIIKADDLLVTQATDGCWIPTQHAWDIIDNEGKDLIPNEMRKRVIILFPRYGPWVTRYFTPVQLRKNEAVFEIAAWRWKLLGYNTQVLGNDYKIEDYIDANHFSASASGKIAETMANEIRDLSRRLGYDD